MAHLLERAEAISSLPSHHCEGKQLLGCSPPCATKEKNMHPSDNVQVDDAVSTSSFSMEVCPNSSADPLQSSAQQNYPEETYNRTRELRLTIVLSMLLSEDDGRACLLLDLRNSQEREHPPSRIRRHADSLQRSLFTMKEKEKQNRFLLLSKLAALEQMENNLFLLTNRQKQLEDFVAAERALLTSGNEHAATTSESPVVSKSGKRNCVKALEKVKVDLSKLQLRIVQANASIAVMKSKLEMNKSSIQLNEERLQAVQEAIRAKEDTLQCKMEAKQKAFKAKKDKEEEKRPQSQKLLSNTSRTVVFGNGADEQEQAAEKPSPFELLRTEGISETISSNNSAEEQLINAIVEQDGSADHLYYCQLYDASVQLKNTLPHVQDILCKSSYEQVVSPACQFYVIKLASLNEKCYAFSVIDTGDDELTYTDELYNAETLTELLTDKEEKSDESDDAYNSLSNYYTNDLLPATDTSGCKKPIGLQLIGICFDLEHSCHDHPMYDMLMNMQAERMEVPEVQAKVEVQKKLSVPKESISAILNEQTAKKSIQTLQAFGFEATSSHTIPNERKRPLS